MITHFDAVQFDDFASAVERLSQELAAMRAAGPLSLQEVQEVSSELTRAQLVLNELERVELRERGASRDLAERFVVLESKVRALQEEIFHEMQRPRPPAGGKGGHAHDPAG